MKLFDRLFKRKGYVGPIDGSALMPTAADGTGGWWNIVRESFAGAWQRNIEVSRETLLSFAAVYACITLIQSDIGKLRTKLMSIGPDDIWTEISAAAFSPVLRKPNSYQTHIDFKECWINSKLRTGNTYVLKERDGRGNVVALYVLDPLRVHVLAAEDGTIFYQLSRDNLNTLQEPTVIVPASEIIHDRMNCLFHPLIGISPLFACHLAACTGLEIQKNQAKFFANGAKISGIITAPGPIGADKAKAVADKFNTGYTGENAGKVAVLGDGLKFQALTMTSTDAQLIEQLKISGEQVCSTFHVPAFKVGIGQMPTFNNIEALDQSYYSQCLQTLIEKMECLLDEGLNLPAQYTIELDLDGLLRMDSSTMMATVSEGVKGSIYSPDEARKKFNLKAVPGGKYPLAQQQNFSLEALSKRDALPNPFVIDRPSSNPTPSDAGPAPAADPNQTAKGITVEQLEGEFELVLSQVAPLALAAPSLRAA